MFDGIELFAALDDNEKNKLSIFCQERLIKSWEIILNEWDDATALYIVKNWKLEVFRSRSDWYQILGFVGNGDIVGEMAIFNAVDDIIKKRMASVKALEDTNIIVMMNYSILDLSKKHSDIYEKILNIIDQRRIINQGF